MRGQGEYQGEQAWFWNSVISILAIDCPAGQAVRASAVDIAFHSDYTPIIILSRRLGLSFEIILWVLASFFTFLTTHGHGTQRVTHIAIWPIHSTFTASVVSATTVDSSSVIHYY